MGEDSVEVAKLEGLKLQYWSRHQLPDRHRGTLIVDHITSDAIEISGESFKPRRIQRSDFDYVASMWNAYKTGQLRRGQLNRSQNTTYILTLLHWLDSNEHPSLQS